MTDSNEVRNSWDAIAGGYDEFVTGTHAGLANEAIQRVRLASSMRFLDIAAGSGALSLPAAQVGADVLATDISPVMVERLQARAQQRGLSNLTARVMDGHNLDLDDNFFDVVGSQFGVMVFPDLRRALAEMVRVTKPDGRVLVVAYGSPQQVEFIGFFMHAMKTAMPDFPGLPMDPPPLPFQLADPERFSQKLMQAGLKDVCIETVTERLEFQSGNDLWNWVINSNPIARSLIADLTDTQIQGVRQALDELVRERADGHAAAVLNNPAHIGIGTK